jgi:hypothetical protein
VSQEAPKRLVVDPDYDLLRWLYPSEVPPSVNHLKGASPLLIVLAGEGTQDLHGPVTTLVQSLGVKDYQVVPERDFKSGMLGKKSVMVVGFPESAVLRSLFSQNVSTSKDGFSFQGKPFGGSSHHFFGVFPHPSDADRVAALFFPTSGRHVGQILRKVSHYGRYSFLVFRDTRNIGKGVWPVLSSPLIHVWK